ncbi:MAG: hypothetical protein ACRYG7_46255 [Janthinobacterium lividum]
MLTTRPDPPPLPLAPNVTPEEIPVEVPAEALMAPRRAWENLPEQQSPHRQKILGKALARFTYTPSTKASQLEAQLRRLDLELAAQAHARRQLVERIDRLRQAEAQSQGPPPPSRRPTPPQ